LDIVQFVKNQNVAGLGLARPEASGEAASFCGAAEPEKITSQNSNLDFVFGQFALLG